MKAKGILILIILIIVLAVVAIWLLGGETEIIPEDESLQQAQEEAEKIKLAEETADWQVYQNQQYGYSFKYPAGCLLGALPVHCKEKEPAERPEECLCYLDNENPDEISLGAFTGPKDNLNDVSFIVFHFDTEAYSPPVSADLIAWLKEKFPTKGIPEKPNTEINGLPAAKVYIPQSPMAHSQENIYFIKNGALFNISMINVDNTDNRALYNKILATFQVSEIAETIEVKAGNSFSVILDANATTGYEWTAEFDGDYIELTSKEYITNETDAEIVGAGGKANFDFKAKKPGNTEITFSYLREWEKDTPPIEQKIYQITIQ